MNAPLVKASKPPKRPESVLVVVHTACEALLLKRVDHQCFWQSVTGSLEWGESPASAAVRELEEETGLSQIALRDTGVCRTYAILPQWQSRYGPDVYRNREHLFFCSLAEKPEIKISDNEHTDYRWLALEQAQHEVFSWSNRIALQMLISSRSASSRATLSSAVSCAAAHSMTAASRGLLDKAEP